MVGSNQASIPVRKPGTGRPKSVGPSHGESTEGGDRGSGAGRHLRLVSTWCVEDTATIITGTEVHTRDLAKGSNSLVCLSIKVEFPSKVRLVISFTTLLDGDFILPNNRLSVKDEERNHPMSFPLVKFRLEVLSDSSGAAEGGQKWLVVRMCVENESEVIGGIDGDRTIFELDEGVWAVYESVSMVDSR